MKMRKRVLSFPFLCFAVSILFCSQSFAVLLPPYIQGTSTATLVEGGQYDGWYLYEIQIDWDLNSQGAGLSHWDLILKTGCGEADHLIEFPAPAGYSTSEEYPNDPLAMGWTGFFLREGDPSLNPVTDPVVKFNEPHNPAGTPGAEGYGTFRFYANIIPEFGTYTNALVAKAGTIPDTYGDLTGAYPSCTIIPEPATLTLLVLGGLALLRKHK